MIRYLKIGNVKNLENYQLEMFSIFYIENSVIMSYIIEILLCKNSAFIIKPRNKSYLESVIFSEIVIIFSKSLYLVEFYMYPTLKFNMNIKNLNFRCFFVLR